MGRELSSQHKSWQVGCRKVVQESVGLSTATILEFPPMGSPEHNDGPLPNRVREWRKRRGLTLQQLAPKANITYGHLGAIEVGRREMSQVVMDKLAEALGVPTADLLNLDAGGLTEQERELIRTYREIPAPMRKSIDAVAEAHQQFRGFGEIAPMRDRKAG